MAGPSRAAPPAAGPAQTCSCAVLREIGPVPNMWFRRTLCGWVRFRLAMCFGSPSVVALTFYYAQPG